MTMDTAQQHIGYEHFVQSPLPCPSAYSIRILYDHGLTLVLSDHHYRIGQ